MSSVLGNYPELKSQPAKTDFTRHSRLVPFEDVDVILQSSELFLHFLKNSFNLFVWPCIEAVVDVITMLCGCSWGAISAISGLSEGLTRHKQHQEQQSATITRENTSHCANSIKAQLNRS